MKFTPKQTRGLEFIEDICSKYHSDSTFKNRLLEDPLKAIREVNSNFRMPQDSSLAISLQDNPNIIYLNIPAKVKFNDVELSEQQLEQVSGGKIPNPLWLLQYLVIF